MDQKGKRKLAAVMFTDIEGYTALVSNDEERALSFVRRHRESLINHTQAHHGEVIEFYGDGSLSIYDSALDAVHCAIEMQKEYRTEDVIPVRIGIHLGDIMLRDGSVFGNGVNVASRIESVGVSGNILCSDRVEDELKNKDHINTKSLGKYAFKNVKKPIEIFAIDHPALIVPTKHQIKGPKGKAVKNKLIAPLVIAFILFAALSYYFFLRPSQPEKSTIIQEQKIVVPPFKNFTGDPAHDYIGEMTAHWLTKELTKTKKSNVVAFHSSNEIKQLISDPGKEKVSSEFATQIGAYNVLDGSYNLVNRDSIEFSAYIKQLNNGEIKISFDKNKFAKEIPAKGISKLSSSVLGYWDAKDDLLLSMPNFEAYRLYMKARQAHNTK